VEATPAVIGTKGYLAPEMEHRTYSLRVDIWPMGVVGFKLFVSARPQGWHVPLCSQDGNSVENLLGRTPEWDPEERISASVALNHPCLHDTDTDEEAAAKAVQMGNKRAYEALLTPYRTTGFCKERETSKMHLTAWGMNSNEPSPDTSSNW
jgi:serine/threonine protein kinase